MGLIVPKRNSRFWFRLVVAATVAISVVATAAVVLLDRQRARDAAERHLANVAKVLESHTIATLRAAELQLAEMVDLIGGRDPAELRDSRRDWHHLAEIARKPSSVYSLWVYDRHGRGVLNSRGVREHLDVADRQFFLQLRDGAPTTISRMLTGRVAGGDMIIVVARRLQAPDGTFLGAVSAAVTARHFNDSFHDAELNGPKGVFAVLHADGSLVFRSPLPDIEHPRGRFARQVARLEGREGVQTLVYEVDGVARLFAYRWIHGYPLVTTAAMTLHAVYRAWWQRTTVMVAGACLWLGVLGLLAAYTDRVLGREHAARAVAEQASAAKERFFASANHDLRQPLQALRLYVDLLVPKLAGSPHQRAIDAASEALRSAESLLHSLLDFARLDSGTVQLRPQEVALNELFARLAHEMAPQATAKGLELRLCRSGAVVRTDPLAIERILRNLLANAIRYTDRGGVVVGCRRRGGAAVVEVWDTGRGIPDEKIDYIWEEFFQIDNPARDRSHGLGLGLAIAMKLARALGHRLSVASRPGRGTVFRLTLPLVRASNRSGARRQPCVREPAPLPSPAAW